MVRNNPSGRSQAPSHLGALKGGVQSGSSVPAGQRQLGNIPVFGGLHCRKGTNGGGDFDFGCSQSGGTPVQPGEHLSG